MICQVELNVFIAAEFNWKPLRPESFDQAINMSSIGGSRNSPSLVSQFDIELTLAKRCIPSLRGPEEQKWALMHEAQLTDAAFLPRTYALRLEKGNFVAPSNHPFGWEPMATQRYALRLSFDPSPYPPRNEWKKPERGPDAMKMWDWKEFVGGALSNQELQDSHASGRNCTQM